MSFGASMLVRRCAIIFVHLTWVEKPNLTTLLEGGDGRERTPCLLLYAPHLGEPVQVSIDELCALQYIDGFRAVRIEELTRQHGEVLIESLLEKGLVLSVDGNTGVKERRDQVVRDVPWRPIDAVAMMHGRWSQKDLAAGKEAGTAVSLRHWVRSFGLPPTHDYQRGTEGERLKLSEPQITSLTPALVQRSTCRRFSPALPVTFQQFSTILSNVWGAQGEFELTDGVTAVKKSAPSGGGLHAVEAYLLVQRVESVTPGLYHYLPSHNCIERLRVLTSSEARTLAGEFVAGQSWFRDASVIVIMTARFDRLFWKYRCHDKSWRVAHLDAGHLSQTMYLAATQLGVGAFVSAAVNDCEIETALGLEPLREGVITLAGFGIRDSSTGIKQ